MVDVPMSPYLHAYILAGCVLGIASWVRAPWHEGLGSRITAFVFLAFLWPVLVFTSNLLESKAKRELYPEVPPPEPPNPDFDYFKQLADQPPADISEHERARIARISERGTQFFPPDQNFSAMLDLFWEHDIPPEAYYDVENARRSLRVGEVHFSRAARDPDDWFIGFSREFSKSIAKVDKNKRARLLEAIGYLAESPTTPHGDTVMPLGGDKQGLWRYRIGEDRLIYRPNQDSRKVVLVSFGPRGDAYNN
jgi:mRNA-degrading endonuclease RelE of RelBE toxin-antitoxin system